MSLRRINVFSYGFVASPKYSRLSFVVISLTSLAMEQGAEEKAINNHTGALSAPVTFSREGYPLACNPIVGMSHDTPSPRQLSGMSILSTPARQVCPAGPGWSDEPIYQLGHGGT